MSPPVVRLLEEHAPRAEAGDEAEAVAATLAFVAAHPDHLLRTCREGHLTGSAWIVSPDRSRVLLTHHRKLGLWVQLGGHADGDPDLRAVALREAREESGLEAIVAVSPGIYDVDRHRIPPWGGEPAHWHHDLRFLFEADPALPLTVNRESRTLRWVGLDEVAALNPEASLRRLVRKTPPA